MALAKSALVHSGLSSSKTGGLGFRGMASHFFCLHAAQADRPVSLVTNRENQAMRDALDQSVCAISRFAVFETIVADNRQNVEIDPARKRYAVPCKTDRFLGRIEVRRLSYIQSDCATVKTGRGAM